MDGGNLSNMDLDLEHYSVTEILRLFSLDHRCTGDDLRGARRRVAAMHPDRSGLDPKFFAFFKKAYTIAENTIGELCGRERRPRAREDPVHDQVLADFASSECFSEKFNEMFDKHVSCRTHGHGGWLSTSEECGDSHTELEKRRDNQLVIACDAAPHARDIGIGSALVDDADEWSGPAGGADVRKAHTSVVVVPKAEADVCAGRPSDLEAIRRARGDSITPMTEVEAEAVLRTRSESEGAGAFQRAIELAAMERSGLSARSKLHQDLKRLTHK